jgi:lysophospholipase L1-like esterase
MIHLLFSSRRALTLAGILTLAGCADSSGSDDTSSDDTSVDDTSSDDTDLEGETTDDDPPKMRDATVPRDSGLVDASKPAAPDASVPAADARVQDAEPPKQDASNDAAVDASIPEGELCELKSYQVGVMGDSYIDLSGDVTKFLQENARKAGALGATETYIDKSRSGAAMQKGNLLAPAIPTQLPTLLSDSKRLGPEGVKLVVMTGGGNDVLIDASQCKTISTPTEECKTVVSKSLAVIEKLFADMSNAGIEHVIYFWYPDLGPSQGRAINDYSVPLAKEQCETSTDVTCHFVDTREPFRGHPEYISLDGIHPTAAGSRVISDLVWDVMVDNCLGSK